MPTYADVRKDDDGVSFWHEGDEYILAQIGKRWRVYEDATTYNARSGLVMLRGPVMRDVDGSIFSFATQDDAERWITDGCKVSLG